MLEEEEEEKKDEDGSEGEEGMGEKDKVPKCNNIVQLDGSDSVSDTSDMSFVNQLDGNNRGGYVAYSPTVTG